MPMRLLPQRLVGQTIRGIRNRLGMSQADFASAVGAANAAEVARWEKGQVQPDYGTLAKIATMGVVDVLVFHDGASAAETPQITPGEANELRDILMRMESLLDDARRLVDRASNRTALEALEAATGSVPAITQLPDAVVLDAEVRLETKPRSRTASASRRSASRATPSATPRKRSSSTGKSGSTAGTGTTASGSSAGETSGSGSSSRGSSRSGSGSSSRGRSGSSRGQKSPGGTGSGSSGGSAPA
ncbi:helix-turn-helix transcriptional regulator [Longimicrobium sp.]|uniref:helix-turn-helix transcriptional regulator n=1 Tax=Longimicrobium sp. TaxID=2029185 RepID=UPI002B8309F2|nr:helix-turn-helix transcriptional regulator [Longimicrobium sp.]HSU15345.1 helix-turn-helix transcriptional regulator [Longimicrobium sp.]